MSRKIGDLAFEQGKLELAKESYPYSLGLDEDLDHLGYVTFKLAWVLVNLESYQQCLKVIEKGLTRIV